MRKSLWIMLAVMVVAVGAPNAHADSFTYSYSTVPSPFGVTSWTTVAIPGATMQTAVSAADLTASDSGFPGSGCVVSSVLFGGTGDVFTFFSGCDITKVDDQPFALSDYTTPGTYGNATGSTLVVTAAVTAPEPSSVALMLLGVGLVFVMRKRNSRGHQLAA